ncbi:MAG: tripartite tricarboxylate transporter TctB family protein [Candidatus Rokubacteria bacterium]|nr:tripartite tricarboxylate transporter TctB family protein [Candidatus Rokubacteria bacterium]
MHRDAVVGGLLALLSLFLLWETREIPHPPLIPIGPAFYPRAVLSVFLLLSLLLLISGLRAPLRVRARDWSRWFSRYRVILASFLLFGLYVLALPFAGYLLSTTLFTAAMQWVLGRRGFRRFPGILVVAVGTSLGTYVVFQLYLHVLLPRGALFQ